MLTRRTFVAGAAGALVASVVPPPFLARAARAADARRRVVVAIFQRGAVDGLGMVPVPGDPWYARVRPTIAIHDALDLDGRFALHPALAPLRALWDNGSLAIVHACGSPDATRSHFDAQDYMESGTPGVKRTPDGWLSRAVSALPPPTRRRLVSAVAVGPSLPRILRGAADAIAFQNVGDFDVRATPAAARAFEALWEDGGSDALHVAGRETFEALRQLKAANVTGLAPAHGAAYPRGRLGDSLRQLAQLVRADVGLAVGFADCGGWDTHVAQGNERGQLAARLAELGAALAAFATDLGDRMADVVVVTMSEFGRTVAENGNRGTDHGHGTAMLVLGGGVRGRRVYGEWPGLAPAELYERRDLAVTTDFRALFSEIATAHLGVPPSAPVFPGWQPRGAPLRLFG